MDNFCQPNTSAAGDCGGGSAENWLASADTREFMELFVDWEKLIMDEIANPRIRRKDVAHTYRILLEKRLKPDWKKINLAIIARWSESALVWIKTTAWTGKGLEAAK